VHTKNGFDHACHWTTEDESAIHSPLGCLHTLATPTPNVMWCTVRQICLCDRRSVVATDSMSLVVSETKHPQDAALYVVSLYHGRLLLEFIRLSQLFKLRKIRVWYWILGRETGDDCRVWQVNQSLPVKLMLTDTVSTCKEIEMFDSSEIHSIKHK
jgi:hypothetical protein